MTAISLGDLPTGSIVRDDVSGAEVTKIDQGIWKVTGCSVGVLLGDRLDDLDLLAGGDSALVVTRVGGAL